MERHLTHRPNDDQLWFRLAETQGQAGNIAEVHKARAEYFRLLGDYINSRQQLQFALRVETEKGAAPAEAARLRQRIREVEELAREARG